MKFILGVKDSMTQLFDENGNIIPVTAINVTPNTVTAIKTVESDGYSSIQLGRGDKKEKNINKAETGHLAKSGAKNLRELVEFRVDSVAEYNLGDEIKVDIFEEGEKLELSSISKGKGFQGGVKRHNFSGGRRSHGNKHAEREGGSIGDMGAQRVMKGKKMPGRMGSDRITVKNLKLVKVDVENSRIFVKGAFAGHPGTLVEIKKK